MKSKERKLTKLELQRKEKFDKYSREMEMEGYLKKNTTISVLRANILGAVLALPIMYILQLIYYNVNVSSVSKADATYFSNLYLLFLVVFMLLVVVHELIHGITWSIFAKNGFKSISFGMIWKYFSPYCTCDSSMKRNKYIIGTRMPTILLGIIPAIVAIYIGNEFLFYIGQVMILCGCGDMCILLEILKYKSSAKEVEYMDHPYECGLVIFEK